MKMPSLRFALRNRLLIVLILTIVSILIYIYCRQSVGKLPSSMPEAASLPVFEPPTLRRVLVYHFLEWLSIHIIRLLDDSAYYDGDILRGHGADPQSKVMAATRIEMRHRYYRWLSRLE